MRLRIPLLLFMVLASLCLAGCETKAFVQFQIPAENKPRLEHLVAEIAQRHSMHAQSLEGWPKEVLVIYADAKPKDPVYTILALRSHEDLLLVDVLYCKSYETVLDDVRASLNAAFPAGVVEKEGSVSGSGEGIIPVPPAPANFRIPSDLP